MRLVLANTTFPPETVGGAELVTLWTARELARRGHEVRVVCTQAGAAAFGAAEEVDEGVRVTRLRLPALPGENAWTARPDVLAWARAAFGVEKPDALSLGLFWHLAALAHAAAELGVPFVLQPHLYTLFCFKHVLVQ